MNEGINYQPSFMFQLNSPLTLQQRPQVEPTSPILTLHLLCDLGQVTICKIEMIIMPGRVVVRIESECVKETAQFLAHSKDPIKSRYYFPSILPPSPNEWWDPFHTQTILDLWPGYPLPSEFPFPHILYDFSLHHHRDWPMRTLQNPI